jgi:hypothetical protein
MPAYAASPALRRRRDRVSAGRQLPEPGSVRRLRTAAEVPEAPADLGATGHAFWGRIWSSCDWISPVADYQAVAEAARLMDDQEIARCRATRTGDLRDLRVVITLDWELSSFLASLGFSPEARLKLGVRPSKRL